jgi:hypothetical protein
MIVLCVILVAIIGHLIVDSIIENAVRDENQETEE